MTTYAIINSQTNICENVALDDRPINEISMEPPYFLLDLINTPSLLWSQNEQGEYVQVSVMGEGRIGCIWDGVALVQPKPI